MKVVVEVVVVGVVEADMDMGEAVAAVASIVNFPIMITHLVVIRKMERLEGQQKSVVDMVDLVVVVAVVVVLIMERLLMVNAFVVHLNAKVELVMGECSFFKTSVYIIHLYLCLCFDIFSLFFLT